MPVSLSPPSPPPHPSSPYKTEYQPLTFLSPNGGSWLPPQTAFGDGRRISKLLCGFFTEQKMDGPSHGLFVFGGRRCWGMGDPEATFPVWYLGRPQSPLCARRSLGNGAAPAVFPPLLRESELGTCQCSCLTTVSHLQGELCWRSCSASRRTGLQKKQRSSARGSSPWGSSFLSATASGNRAGRTPSPAQLRLM